MLRRPAMRYCAVSATPSTFFLVAATCLWELGRDDERNLNSNPDHAIRVLADSGRAMTIGKPFVVNDGVLDAMEKLP